MNETNDIKTVGIVGAGLMGTGIAEVTAAAGFQTVLVKATKGDAGDIRARIEKSLARTVEKGKLTAEQRDATLGRLICTSEREALAKVDLVIESIVEDLPTKRALFSELDRIVTPRALFASNTSTLRISDIARGCGREDRTVGLHFFSPVPAMKLVELAHMKTTCPCVVDKAAKFVETLGKTAVPVLDSTGFVVNRLLVPYLIGAIAAFEQGLAKADEIDTAMRLGCGHPVGPLALADLIGLDVVYAMSKLLYADFGDDRYKPPALLRRLVQQGHLGKKTKLGFFDYAENPPRANEAIWNLVRQGAFRPKSTMPRKLLDGMVLGIDHVGICVDDMDQSAQMWSELLGLPVAHRECVSVQKTEAVFVDPPGHATRGDATVELVSPMEGNAGLVKFLEKRGDGMHHLAFAVTDIRECLRRLDEAGVQLLDKEPRHGARGHLVAFLHPKAMNGTLVELVERHPQHGGK